MLAKAARAIGVVVGCVGADARSDDDNHHENGNGKDHDNDGDCDGGDDIDGELGYYGPEYDDAKRHGSAVQCSEL